MKNKEKNKANFVEIVCRRCGNKQTIFGKSAIDIKCNKCNKLLAKTSGGKSKIVTLVKRVFVQRWQG